MTVCEPSTAVVVFQETEYGALVSSAPKLVPSILNCTPAPPTSSEASALPDTVPFTGRLPGEVMLTVGGVVVAGGGGGGGGALATVIVTGSEVNVRPSRPS